MKDKGKAKAAPQVPASAKGKTLEFVSGPNRRIVITDPLPSWRVINSPEYSQKVLKTHQAMLCTQCWCYRTSAFLRIGCACNDSERQATEERFPKPKKTTK